MVHDVFNDAFEALLAGWHRHMDLAASTDDADKLEQSRRELEKLRARADRVRRAPTREDRELEDGQLAAYCPFLDTTVYIPKSDLRYTPEDVLVFDCACEREVGHRPKQWLHETTPVRLAAPAYLDDPAPAHTASHITRS